MEDLLKWAWSYSKFLPVKREYFFTTVAGWGQAAGFSNLPTDNFDCKRHNTHINDFKFDFQLSMWNLHNFCWHKQKMDGFRDVKTLAWETTVHYFNDAFLSLLFICYKVQMSSCSRVRARITPKHIQGFKWEVIFKVQGWFTHTSSLYHSITAPLDLKITWSLQLTFCFEAFFKVVGG